MLHLQAHASLLLFASLLLSLQDMKPTKPDDKGLKQILEFEEPPKDNVPGGWTNGPGDPGGIFADDKIVHGGRFAGRIERKDKEGQGFTSMERSIPLDFKGSKLELRGFLRTDAVTDFAGLWLRENDDSTALAFDNMEKQHIHGSSDWKQYKITLPLERNAKTIQFGCVLSGTGTAWADDLELLVDGKPVWEAQHKEVLMTAIDLDHEFDGGSGIALTELSKVQIENLATLGKVWGFLKYHHPAVTSGKHHWDYELLRVLPTVLDCQSNQDANAALCKWIDGLGSVEPCKICATLKETDLHLRPELAWSKDEVRLGPELAKKLAEVHANRSRGKQFFISLIPGVGNPSFEHEPAYGKVAFPDAGFQLLAVFRFWNIIEYWFPYRDQLDENWDSVLISFIPRVVLARDDATYKRELMALIAKATDTHCNLWSSLDVRPPEGKCQAPIQTRFIENQAVVVGFESEEAKKLNVKVGDVIVEIDGIPVTSLVARWSPYYAASNQAARLRDIAGALTHGACDNEVNLKLQRGTDTIEVKTKRAPSGPAWRTHDLAGDTFRLLSDDVAYLKLSSVKIAEVDGYVEKAKNTKGLIIDIRNYPSEFVVFALGGHLIEKATPFTRFTQGDLSNPGAFHWSESLSLPPIEPQYKGKVVILIDEVSQSQAEYTTMALRASPNAQVIGSTTAGADGNVSAIPLPGGLRSMISGIGVFYPDKKPTQRIGIVPDIEKHPTIAGIAAGRDEVLEAAIRQILGAQAPEESIRKIAKPNN